MIYKRFYILVLLVFFIISCEKKLEKEPENSLKEIVIGDINSILISKEYSQNYYAGAYLAIEEINSKGGINGLPIRLVVKNDFGSQIEAYNGAKIAVEKDKALVLMGTMLPQTAGGVARYAKDSKTTFLNTGSPTESIFEEAYISNYVYRFRDGYNVNIEAISKAITENKTIKSITIITYSNGEGDYLANKIENSILNRNRNIFIRDIRIPQGSTLATNTQENIYTAPTQAVVIAVTGRDLENLITTLQREKLLISKLVFVLFAGESEWLDNIGNLTPKGWTVTGHPWYSINTPENKEFFSKYQKKYKIKPRYASYLGYSAVYFVAKAIQNAHPFDNSQRSKDKINDAMKTISISSPLGIIRMRKDQITNLGTHYGIIAPYNRDKKKGKVTTRILDVRMFESKKVDTNNTLNDENNGYKIIQENIAKHKRLEDSMNKRIKPKE